MIAKVQIPGTGMSICRVGFGCARVFGGSELKAAARLIETALGAGIRHFDTAPTYGNGHSESALGVVLAGVSDVTITTKIGIQKVDSTSAPRATAVAYRRFIRPLLSYVPNVKSRIMGLAEWSRHRAPLPAPAIQRYRLAPSDVLRNLDESLKRLKRDAVNLYLIHEPDQVELTDELRELFVNLQKDGVIGAYGLAFGRAVDTAPDFGTIVQGRYHPHIPIRCAPGKLRIFHGVLRYSESGAVRPLDANRPDVRLNNVLKERSDCAIIFSASAPHQIKGVKQ